MKNILLIVVDTLRPDHLGCYGYHRQTSPHLDNLAQKSTVFDNIWSASNFTAPAFTSLFTGLYPHQHGVFDFTAKAPSSLIHDTLKANGVTTHAVVSFRFFTNLLKDIWGSVEAVTDTRSRDFAEDLPMSVTHGALEWLRTRQNEQPFCLFCHYDGPHLPFRLPPEFARTFDEVREEKVDPAIRESFFPEDDGQINSAAGNRGGSMFQLLEMINWGRHPVSPDTLQWVKDKYDASVYYNDHAIGTLLSGLKNLGLDQDTLVMVLSDHGEEFLEHGAIGHGGIHLHEETIRTVGILHDPAQPEKTRIKRPVSQIDIFPGLCRLAGASPIPDLWSGTDLKVDLTSSETPIFCHGKSKIAVRKGAWKYISTKPSPVLGPKTRLKIWLKMLLRKELGSEIYNLDDDPGEQVNCIKNKPLKKTLDDILNSHLAAKASDLGALAADEEEQKRIEQEMKDLGYM